MKHIVCKLLFGLLTLTIIGTALHAVPYYPTAGTPIYKVDKKFLSRVRAAKMAGKRNNRFNENNDNGQDRMPVKIAAETIDNVGYVNPGEASEPYVAYRMMSMTGM